MSEPTPKVPVPAPHPADEEQVAAITPEPEAGPDFVHLIPRRRVSRLFIR